MRGLVDRQAIESQSAPISPREDEYVRTIKRHNRRNLRWKMKPNALSPASTPVKKFASFSHTILLKVKERQTSVV